MDRGEEPHLSTIISSCPAPQKLELKQGAEVILLKNIDPANGLVNGARGKVVSFIEAQVSGLVGSGTKVPVVEFLVSSECGAGEGRGCGRGE